MMGNNKERFFPGGTPELLEAYRVVPSHHFRFGLLERDRPSGSRTVFQDLDSRVVVNVVHRVGGGIQTASALPSFSGSKVSCCSTTAPRGRNDRTSREFCCAAAGLRKTGNHHDAGTQDPKYHN